jgi:hypothetical protein
MYIYKFWFISNLRSLNIDKTQFIQFLTESSNLTYLSISYENKHIIKVLKVKFLCLTMDNNLLWNFYIQEIISKLNTDSFAIKSIRDYMPYIAVTMIYIIIIIMFIQGI